ncbi:flocculation protein FLO11 isoform X1 [Hyalella azteca]|uniref:Flocculation protein FLO11 isoform X1 n=1 Tax=Hyalella azteca TaxID=294128 RepID=A0A979FN78_HYAAZ|nr:flocculation protein FLO11 isoform X1 [Hyalella azteca]
MPSNPYSFGDHYKSNKLSLPTQGLYSSLRLAPVSTVASQPNTSNSVSTTAPAISAPLPDPMACFKGTALVKTTSTLKSVGKPSVTSLTSLQSNSGSSFVVTSRPSSTNTSVTQTKFPKNNVGSVPSIVTPPASSDPMACFRKVDAHIANEKNLNNIFRTQHPPQTSSQQSGALQGMTANLRTNLPSSVNQGTNIGCIQEDNSSKSKAVGLRMPSASSLNSSLRPATANLKNPSTRSLNSVPVVRNTTSNIGNFSLGLMSSQSGFTPSLKNPSSGLKTSSPAYSPLFISTKNSPGLKSPLSTIQSPMMSNQRMMPASSAPSFTSANTESQQESQEEDSSFTFRNPVCIFKHPKSTFRKQMSGSKTASVVRRPVIRPPPSNPLACAIRHANWRKTFMELRKPKVSVTLATAITSTAITTSTTNSSPVSAANASTSSVRSESSSAMAGEGSGNAALDELHVTDAINPDTRHGKNSYVAPSDLCSGASTATESCGSSDETGTQDVDANASATVNDT